VTPPGGHGRLASWWLTSRLPRPLHPLAWWGWAGLLAATALRTTNVLLLGLIAGVVAYTVAARRSTAPWARSFGSFLRLGLIVIVIRVAFQVLFGNRLPGTTILTLPQVDLPEWAAGVSIGGPVTLEALAAAFQQGLRLAVLLICFGAASALTSPYRLLRCLPAALYEVGVALTVALAFAPQAVLSAGRVREAQRLRGRPSRGLRSWRGIALPVLEGALDRSIALAASMDGRGYGRRAGLSRRDRVAGAALLLGGLVAVTIGTYGVLDATAPSLLGLPMLAAGSLGLAGALVTAGRRSVRTRYRPDPWRAPEWVTVGSAAVAMLCTLVAARQGADLQPSVSPLQAPTLPLLPALGALVAITPAHLTPPSSMPATSPDLPSTSPHTSPSASPAREPEPIGISAVDDAESPPGVPAPEGVVG
jgi:energy-coupling factor transport system permease protein